MSRLINLQVYCPNPKDITSLYRAVGPLSRLRQKYPHLNVTVHSTLEWPILRMADVVFVQRPFTDSHVTLIEMAKNEGMPVWIDWDDDLTSIPRSNPHYPAYSSPRIVENLKKSANLADVITVTTEPLKAVHSDNVNKIRVIPNALDDIFYKDLDKINYDNRNGTVAWRGGESHNLDIMEVRDQLIALSKQHPKWFFTFMGYNPFLQLHGMREGSYGHIPSQEFMVYMKTMKSLSAPLMMIPLSNDTFNRSKSMIAWLEASVAGSACIAPEYIPDFNRPGVFTYKDTKHFGNLMHTVMSNPNIIGEANKVSLEYIKDNLLLSKINEQRMDLIKDLTDLL